MKDGQYRCGERVFVRHYMVWGCEVEEKSDIVL